MPSRATAGPLAAVLITLLLAGLLAGCDAGPGPDPATSAACDAEQRPPEQSGGHVLPGQAPAVAYSSVPPTSGWHAAGNVPARVYGDDVPLAEPSQVTVLELGGIVLTHHGLDQQDRLVLEAFAREQNGRVAVTPYDRLAPGEVAMTAWGVLRRCEGVNLEVIRAFVDEHHGGGPAH